MLKVIYSNSPDNLLTTLTHQLGLGASAPCQAMHLVVPNNYTATSCKLAIARDIGIAINIITYNGLKQLFSSIFCRPDNSVKVITVNMLQQLLLAALQDEIVTKHKELSPLAHYLELGDELSVMSELERETKRFDLTKNLALLFLEYEQYRPEMVKKWNQGKLNFPNDPLEIWQSFLWRQIFAPGGLRDELAQQKGSTWLLLGEILDRKLLPSLLNDHPDLHDIHLFGLLTTSPLHLELLNELGQNGLNIYLYSQNPCQEYWEDVVTGKKAKFSKNLELSFEEEQTIPADPLAMQLWGQAGKEHIGALNELCKFSPHEDFSTINYPPTVLGALQHDLRTRQVAENGNYLLPADSSLTITEAYYERREVEDVANDIGQALLKAAQENKRLHYNEIAIIIPSGDKQATYQQLLQSTFAAMGNMPLVFTGASQLTTQPLIQTIINLLALPGSDFARSKMMAVLESPFVMRNISGTDSQQWLHWCNDLAIFNDDQTITQINESDIYSWEQGLKRLLLGYFLPGEQYQDKSYVLGNTNYYPAHISDGDQDNLAAFYLLVTTLRDEAKALFAGHNNLSTWCQKIKNYLGYFVRCEQENEQRLFNKVLKALDKLNGFSMPNVTFNYQLVRKLLLEELGAIVIDNHQPVTEGIVVGNLNNLRPLSFKRVYMLSMEDSVFPTNNQKLPFDLRTTHHQSDDISPRQWQLYHFLELLTTCKEELHLSYLSKNPLTGDDQSPSPVIDDLKLVLATNYLAPDQTVTKTSWPDHYDYHLFADEPFLSISAFKEAEAHFWHGKTGAEVAAFIQNNPLLMPPSCTGLRPPEITGHQTISLKQLENFLHCPLQAYSKRLLIDTQYKSRIQSDQEPLAPDFFANHQLEQDLLVLVCQGADLDFIKNYIINTTDRFAYQGKMPTGLFLTNYQNKKIAIWSEHYQNIHEILGPEIDNVTMFRFGEDRYSSSFSQFRQLDPLQITITIGQKPLLVTLTGSTGPIIMSGGEARSLIKAKKDKFTIENKLHAALEGAFLTASGVISEFQTIQLLKKEKKKFLYNINQLNQDYALSWLRDLLTDYFSQPHNYLLPLELVEEYFKIGSKTNKETFNRWPEKSQKRALNMYESLKSDNGPINNARQYPIPALHEVSTIINRRYRPLI